VDESWVSVAQFSDPTSARVASGRLTAENIPNAVWREAFSAYHVRVPPDSLDPAKQTLEATAKLDEEELTQHALEEPPPDDYVPVTSTSSFQGDPQARHLAVLMPIGSAILFLICAGNFAIGLMRFMDRGVVYPTFCTAAGCRSSIMALVVSGVGALLMLGAFLGSLGVGRRDK
jgi:hypothetical protein